MLSTRFVFPVIIAMLVGFLLTTSNPAVSQTVSAQSEDSNQMVPVDWGPHTGRPESGRFLPAAVRHLRHQGRHVEQNWGLQQLRTELRLPGTNSSRASAGTSGPWAPSGAFTP